MTIALEILAYESDSGKFGEDGLAPPDLRIVLDDPTDSSLIVFGPPVVSWNGRLIQVPVMIPWTASSHGVRFHIERGVEKSPTIFPALQIVDPPQSIISISGTVLLGDGGIGRAFAQAGSTTLVVEGLDLSSANPFDFSGFSVTDSSGVVINTRLHPMTILSRGPIRIGNTTLSVSADSINGGPGGGGGGAGFIGTGGYGYTGGGSSDTQFVETNKGSGSGPNALYGGGSKTGVRGGQSDDGDQGGGGGTGIPFGSSGTTGARNSASFEGGFGGASAGGEAPGAAYGGGGGGFATRGEQGAGLGDNGGKASGGRFLVPMMGGSGGGAGNSQEVDVDTNVFSAGSGGGGGGAMTIIGFQTLDLTNGRLRADGARGASGKHPREGGGGGGSGGSILIGARGTVTGNPILSTTGGAGGLGGGANDSSARGGNGGFGRIRFDADIPCISCDERVTYGPALSIPAAPIATTFIQLSGFAGSTDLSDSIRIYYRTRHTSWQRADTIRFQSGNAFRWQKSIPTPPDSLLFVCIYAKVNAPERSFANYEPDWLTGHLASGVISVVPRTELVVSPETLDIGCIKVDSCIEGLVYLENRGEARLKIDSIYTTNTLFAIQSPPSSLDGYNPTSVRIRYCPDAVRSDTAQLIIIADGKRYEQTIMFGCGIDKDRRIRINDTTGILGFDPLHKDSCVIRSFWVESIGEDPVDISPNTFVQPPFKIVYPQDTVILKQKGDSVAIRVEFCPQDSGQFRAAFFLTERRDSFVVRGTGTRKLLFAPDTFWIGDRCVGTCMDTALTLYSTGNEGVSMTGISAGSGIELPPFTPHRLEAGARESIRFKLCFDSLGERSDRIIYNSDADTPIATIVKYKVIGVMLDANTIDLGGICAGTCDSAIAVIRNTGAAFTIDSIILQNNILEIFDLIDVPSQPQTISGGDSIVFMVRKCPESSGIFRDTLLVYITQGECDSVFSLPVYAASSDAEPILSQSAINFDETDTGFCVTDTILLDNPCPADITITLGSLAPPFELVEPSLSPILVGGGNSIRLIYRFCPIDSIEHVTQDTIRTNGNTLIVNLSGKGRIRDAFPLPFVRFALGHVDDALVREDFGYRIDIDSSFRLNDIDSIHGEMRFDPIVAQPRRIDEAQNGWQIAGSEFIPGIFTFDAVKAGAVNEGAFVTFTIQALRSRRDSTAVVFQNVRVLPQGKAQSDTGSIKTNACDEPPANIVIPGAYKLGEPTPNPSQSSLTVPLLLGTDGILNLKLYSAQGALVLSRSEPRTKGEHQIMLDVASIPAGVYVLEAESWGWRERKQALIVK